MAGIVRKLFKSAGGGSSRKISKKEAESDSDGDYAELHFGPTTSSAAATPSKKHYSDGRVSGKTPSKTPRIRHDETMSGDDDDDHLDSDDVQNFRKTTKPSEDVHLQIRHQNQMMKPTSLKRRRHQNPYGSESSLQMSSRIQGNDEDSIYEHTQYQLAAYGRQAARHDAKRRKRRETEQENRIFDGIGGMRVVEKEIEDVGTLRAERDQWKRDAEKYKTRCEELEKKLNEMKRRQQFQPYHPNFNVFSSTPFMQQAPPTPYLFQPGAPGAFNFVNGGNLNFGANLGANLNGNLNGAPMPGAFLPQMALQMAPGGSSAPFSLGSAPFSLASSAHLDSMGPVGPMAPRYPDPVNDSLLFEDEDTSLSDLSSSSNSSKSSEEGAPK